jgi:hypothetical protein
VKRLALAIALAASSASAHAATSPFVGHWTLDPAKSNFAGDIVTYTKTAKGFRSASGSVTYAFAVDGKDYPTVPGYTISWTKSSDGGWDVTAKVKGTVSMKAHRMISPDGKHLITTYTNYRPDGSTTTEKDVYDRLSGAGGLAGEWKEVKVDAAVSTLDIDVPAPGAFKLANSAYKEVIEGKTDGSKAVLSGPTIPPNAGAVYKAVSADKWDYTFFIGDKVFAKGTLTVSPAGKMLTDVSWTPGKESEKSTGVYLKN